jgi:hypothetical protein
MHAWEADISFVSAPIIAVVILIIPIFDTIRVFSIRILRGKSPFKADRLHMHHLLIDNNLSHMQASFTLYFTTIFFTALTYFARSYFSNTELCFFILFLLICYFVAGNLLEVRRLKLKKEELNVNDKVATATTPAAKEKLRLSEISTN